MRQYLQDHPGIGFPPLALFAVILGLALILHWIYPLTIFSKKWLMQIILGIIPIIIAIKIAKSAKEAMQQAKTPIHPSKPTTAIVTSGSYSFSRNPLYVTFLLLQIALAILINSLWILIFIIFLFIVLDFWVIEREEAYLERKFGSVYLSYKTKVRRWL